MTNSLPHVLKIKEFYKILTKKHTLYSSSMLRSCFGNFEDINACMYISKVLEHRNQSTTDNITPVKA